MTFCPPERRGVELGRPRFFVTMNGDEVSAETNSGLLFAVPFDYPPFIEPQLLGSLIFAASTAGHSSLPAAGSPPLAVRVDTDGPASERLVDERVLDMAVRRARSLSK